MADRTDFFTGQLVTQQDMDVSFDGIEQAIWDAAADMGLYGIITGFAVTESSPNALTVQVASGSAYSGEGKRLRVTDLDTTVDISVDRDANDTTPLTGGNKRYVSVIITPDRTLDDVRPDINQFPVYYRRYESTKIEVIMGAEAPSPAPPDVPVESILLCDILLDFGQTTVADADIDFDRCTYMFSYEYASVVQHYASITEALQSLADIITNNTPAWSTILASYGGSTTWANNAQWLPSSPTTRPLNEAVESYIVAPLASITSTSGAHLLGVYQSAYQSPTVPTLVSGPLFARLESMRDASNIYIAALPPWPDGDDPTNPADSVFDAFSKVISNIGARASSTDQGIQRVGVNTLSFTLPAWQDVGPDGTIYNVFAGFNAATGTYDGASWIGAKASGALLAGTVRSQLDALDTRVTSNTSSLAGKVAKVGDTMTGTLVATPSTLNANALEPTGNGTGSAVYATSGASGGYAIQAIPQIGSGASGIFASADGAGVPLFAVSGANAEAIGAIAGGGNKPAIRASGNGTGPALRCEVGGVHFNGTEPVAGADPGANMAWAASQAKAWANITTNGGGSITKHGDYNVSSVQILASKIVITFAHVFGDINYAPTCLGFDGNARFYLVENGGMATNTCTIVVKDIAGSTIDPATSAVKLSFVAFGRH